MGMSLLARFYLFFSWLLYGCVPVATQLWQIILLLFDNLEALAASSLTIQSKLTVSCALICN